MLLLIFVWIPLSLIVGWAAAQKGRSFAGFFLLSLFFSPVIGLLVALVVPTRIAPAFAPPRASDGAGWPAPAADTKTCPQCAETIRREAIKCRFCGSDVAGAKPALAPATMAGGGGYCPGCGRLRNMALCLTCGDSRPTVPDRPRM